MTTSPVGRKPYYRLRFEKGIGLCRVGRVQEGLEEFDRLLRLVPGGDFLVYHVHTYAVAFATLIGDRSRVPKA